MDKTYKELLMIAMIGSAITIIFWTIVAVAHAQDLKASWYSEKSLISEGTRKAGEPQIMANGKVFNENKLTCATRLYPLGTMLKVTNLDNGKFVIVKVTDRIGKRFAETRIDLSKKAFESIAKLSQGLVPITAEVIE